MLLIPAIDLKDGHCVRLRQGDMDQSTTFGENPAAMARQWIDAGRRYVIIGSAAVKNPGFLKDACSAFGGHIIVGLDARDGKVATDGWSKLTGHGVVDLARKFEDWGVESIIYTDIGRDGMLSG